MTGRLRVARVGREGRGADARARGARRGLSRVSSLIAGRRSGGGICGYEYPVILVAGDMRVGMDAVGFLVISAVV